MKLGELSDLLRELQQHEQTLERCTSNERIAELNSAIDWLRGIDISDEKTILETKAHRLQLDIVRMAKSERYRKRLQEIKSALAGKQHD